MKKVSCAKPLEHNEEKVKKFFTLGTFAFIAIMLWALYLIFVANSVKLGMAMLFGAALASHQIMLTISQFTFMMFYGMGAAIAVRVSNFKGQNDMVNVRRSAYAGYHLILAMAVVLLSIVFLLRNQVGGWFTDSVEVSAMVSSLFLPFLVYQFGDGLQISFANALRGIADVKPMMFIAFISYGVIS